MLRTLVLVVTLVLSGIALSGCLGERIDPSATNDTALPPGHDEHHDETTTSELGNPDIVLEAHAGMPDRDLQLHPTPLQVPLGSVVEIRVENQGQTPHTFTIHEFDADTGTMDPGEERTIKFRADKVGSFEIMCDVAGHYQAGMKATIEVAA